MRPRSFWLRPRPPVENCMIILGQCLMIPSCTCANSSGSELGLSSGLRTWICATEAPASKASCVDLICSLGVTGTAGVSALRGIAPVMATVMMAGGCHCPSHIWSRRGGIERDVRAAGLISFSNVTSGVDASGYSVSDRPGGLERIDSRSG